MGSVGRGEERVREICEGWERRGFGKLAGNDGDASNNGFEKKGLEISKNM